MWSHKYVCAKRENDDFSISGSKHVAFKDLETQDELHQDSKFEIA